MWTEKFRHELDRIADSESDATTKLGLHIQASLDEFRRGTTVSFGKDDRERLILSKLRELRDAGFTNQEILSALEK